MLLNLPNIVNCKIFPHLYGLILLCPEITVNQEVLKISGAG